MTLGSYAPFALQCRSDRVFWGTHTASNTCPACGHNSMFATLSYFVDYDSGRPKHDSDSKCQNPVCDYDEYDDRYDDFRWDGIDWVDTWSGQMRLDI